jgi:hypothetical protein
MTPNPTPTRTYVSERRRPLPRVRALFGHGSYTLTDTSGRKESGSKTAGCRFDSCPTCQQPLSPEFKALVSACISPSNASETYHNHCCFRGISC